MFFLDAKSFFKERPGNPTIVVEGVNSTNVDLIWTLPVSAGVTVGTLFFKRQKSGDVSEVIIASRKSSTAFTLVSDGFETEYRATLPATLRLLNVDNTEEYIYTLQVSYDDSEGVPREVDDKVTVIVRGKSNNFALYLRRFYKSVVLRTFTPTAFFVCQTILALGVSLSFFPSWPTLILSKALANLLRFIPKKS